MSLGINPTELVRCTTRFAIPDTKPKGKSEVNYFMTCSAAHAFLSSYFW